MKVGAYVPVGLLAVSTNEPAPTDAVAWAVDANTRAPAIAAARMKLRMLSTSSKTSLPLPAVEGLKPRVRESCREAYGPLESVRVQVDV